MPSISTLIRLCGYSGWPVPLLLVSLNRLYKECGWLSLTEKRRQQKLSFMFKSHHDLLQTHISDLMPPLIRNISNYPLRNTNNYSVPYARTEIFKKYCIPSAISRNSADNNLKDANTLQSFRRNFKSWGSRL